MNYKKCTQTRERYETRIAQANNIRPVRGNIKTQRLDHGTMRLREMQTISFWFLPTPGRNRDTGSLFHLEYLKPQGGRQSGKTCGKHA